MAKVQTASVRLVLKRNRSNENGDNPIYLVVHWYGKKERSTGVFIPEKYWNASKEEIRKGYPNAIMLNHMIQEQKQRVIDKRNRYDIEGKVYTPAILLEPDRVIIGNSYHVLVENYLIDRHLGFSTERLYRYNIRLLDKFFGRDDYIIEELNVGTIKRFITSLNIADDTKRTILGRIASIWNYAIEKSIVSEKDYPFREWVYTKQYKTGCRMYYLDDVNLVKIKDWFINRCLNIEGSLYSFKEGIEDRLMERYSIEFTGMFLLASFMLYGSSPVDIALLRVDNCSRVNVDGIDCWELNFKRSKTRRPVKVLLDRDNILTHICFEHFLRTAHLRGGLIYPILKDGIDVHERINSMNKFCLYGNRNAKDIARVINSATIESNVKNDKDEPLIDVDNFTLYSMRHSFANKYLSQPGANVHALATLLARSPNTISQYIHQINTNKDILNAAKDLL